MLECTAELELRRMPRSKPKEFSFVKAENGSRSILGTIIDINLHGLSFHYIPGKPNDIHFLMPKHVYTLEIFQSSRYFSLSKIRGHVVYDEQQSNHISFLDFPPRRCGLEFDGLSDKEKHFLLHCIIERK